MWVNQPSSLELPEKTGPAFARTEPAADAHGDPPTQEAVRDDTNSDSTQDEPIEQMAQTDEQSEQDDSSAMEAEPLPDNSSVSIPESQKAPELFNSTLSAASQTNPCNGKHKLWKDSASSYDPKKANNQDSDENSSSPSTFLWHFIHAMKKDCNAKQGLMASMDSRTYYNCRGLHLIYKNGTYSDIKANKCLWYMLRKMHQMALEISRTC